MRRVLTGVLVLALLWCGWWAVAAFGLQRGTEAWFADRQAEGWQAELSTLNLTGFPARVGAQLEGITLADPETGVALRLDRLDLSFRALWPGDLRVDLPGTPIGIATPEGKWQLQLQNAQADLNLHPGTALELENLSLSAGAFSLTTETGVLLSSGTALQAALTQTDAANTYTLDLDVPAFQPGDPTRRILQLPETWPESFETLLARGTITFDTPIDRRTLEDARPQPQAISLDQAEAKWAELRLRATGAALRSPRGFAEGDLIVKAENWPTMLDMGENAGLVPSQYRPQIERVLASLAANTGSTNDLDIKLVFKNGVTRVGFFPIGPAPSMILR